MKVDDDLRKWDERERSLNKYQLMQINISCNSRAKQNGFPKRDNVMMKKLKKDLIYYFYIEYLLGKIILSK